MPRPISTNRNKVRTERVSVVTTPVIKAKIEKIAFMQRKTINEFMNDIMKTHIRTHKDLLDKYNETFGTDDEEEAEPATQK